MSLFTQECRLLVLFAEERNAQQHMVNEENVFSSTNVDQHRKRKIEDQHRMLHVAPSCDSHLMNKKAASNHHDDDTTRR